MNPCLLCRASTVTPLLDFGRQPVSTHFQVDSGSIAAEHDLAFGLCSSCGVGQLLKPFPYRALVPPFDWITYREPERHLDMVVDQVCALPGVGVDAVIAGISYKDHTTLERFRARGFEQIWCIDPRADLGATDPNANIETVHGILTPELAEAIASKRGLADVLIVRHIVEHAEVPWRFLQALCKLLRPGGYLVVEVPDCAANLVHQDYTMVWEEHTLYFTPESFAAIMPAAGCSSLGVDVHPYVFENCLVQIGRAIVGDQRQPVAAPDLPLARRYADAFPRWSAAYRNFLDEAGRRGQVALYGAGHLTCAFVNFHGLADRLAFVVDDTRPKQGLFLPKCNLPIRPRVALDPARVPLCLFGLAPEAEDKVVANNVEYLRGGGRFLSIFATSGRSIRRELTMAPGV
jgi:hypothetical protein